MYVFCAGMYRSCSTWQYEVVSHLLERHRGGVRLRFLTGEEFLAGKDCSLSPGTWGALKTHDGHPAFAAALAEGRARAVYCSRDLRDVAYSLAHKFMTTFEDVAEKRLLLLACQNSDAFWTSQPNVLCQRYRDLIEAPAEGVEQLARHLGIELAEGEAAAIAAEYSREANLRRTATVAEQLTQNGIDLTDPGNCLYGDEYLLLHWNHIREGRVGGWEEQVTPRQLAVLARQCTDWLIARGYEQDVNWWQGVWQRQRLTEEGWRRNLMDAQGEIDRGLRQQAELEARLSQARGDIDRGLRRQAELEAELGQAQSALRQSREDFEDVQGRLQELLSWLEQMGPFALKVAERVRTLTRRHPRLVAGVKRLLRWNAPRPSPALTPSLTVTESA